MEFASASLADLTLEDVEQGFLIGAPVVWGERLDGVFGDDEQVATKVAVELDPVVLVEGNVLAHELVVRVLDQGTVLDVELLVLKTWSQRSCQSAHG